MQTQISSGDHDNIRLSTAGLESLREEMEETLQSVRVSCIRRWGLGVELTPLLLCCFGLVGLIHCGCGELPHQMASPSFVHATLHIDFHAQLRRLMSVTSSSIILSLR